MKEQIIKLPDTLEVKEIKDDKIILVEKEKNLTYEDIAEKLFTDKGPFYINESGEIVKLDKNNLYNVNDLNNCISQKQAQKLLAINQLMNVAKYLNGDWQPDWTRTYERGWYIYIKNKDKIEVSYSSYTCGDVYFRTEKFAQQAIEILGEETIKLALCTDY